MSLWHFCPHTFQMCFCLSIYSQVTIVRGFFFFFFFFVRSMAFKAVLGRCMYVLTNTCLETFIHSKNLTRAHRTLVVLGTVSYHLSIATAKNKHGGRVIKRGLRKHISIQIALLYDSYSITILITWFLLQWTLATTTEFVPKSIAIKMNLLL